MKCRPPSQNDKPYDAKRGLRLHERLNGDAVNVEATIIDFQKRPILCIPPPNYVISTLTTTDPVNVPIDAMFHFEKELCESPVSHPGQVQLGQMDPGPNGRTSVLSSIYSGSSTDEDIKLRRHNVTERGRVQRENVEWNKLAEALRRLGVPATHKCEMLEQAWLLLDPLALMLATPKPTSSCSDSTVVGKVDMAVNPAKRARSDSTVVGEVDMAVKAAKQARHNVIERGRVGKKNGFFTLLQEALQSYGVRETTIKREILVQATRLLNSRLHTITSFGTFDDSFQNVRFKLNSYPTLHVHGLAASQVLSPWTHGSHFARDCVATV